MGDAQRVTALTRSFPKRQQGDHNLWSLLLWVLCCMEKKAKTLKMGEGGESKDEKCQSEQYVFKKSLGCTFFSSLATCCVP